MSREVSHLADLTPEAAAARLTRLAPAGSPPPTSITQASNADLGGLIRGPWGIGSLHWVRDRTFREDESQAHHGAGPQAMAALRNGSIGLLRRLHIPNIAAALRHLQRIARRSPWCSACDRPCPAPPRVLRRAPARRRGHFPPPAGRTPPPTAPVTPSRSGRPAAAPARLPHDFDVDVGDLRSACQVAEDEVECPRRDAMCPRR